MLIPKFQSEALVCHTYFLITWCTNFILRLFHIFLYRFINEMFLKNWKPLWKHVSFMFVDGFHVVTQSFHKVRTYLWNTWNLYKQWLRRCYKVYKEGTENKTLQTKVIEKWKTSFPKEQAQNSELCKPLSSKIMITR